MHDACLTSASRTRRGPVVTIVKLHRRALVPVLGLALLLVPGQSPAAPGVGRVDVTPDHVAAGSTNTFKLTFTADTGPLQGQTLLDIPRGWSLPQASRLGATGYVALARDTCSGATKLVRVAGNRLTIATAGTPFGITVRAEDVYGNTFSGYTGIVSFSSSDPNAFLPTPYQFTSNDFGAKTLGGVILRASGTQTITVSDNAGHVDVSNPITVYSF